MKLLTAILILAASTALAWEGQSPEQMENALNHRATATLYPAAQVFGGREFHAVMWQDLKPYRATVTASYLVKRDAEGFIASRRCVRVAIAFRDGWDAADWQPDIERTWGGAAEKRRHVLIVGGVE